jgi:hypothetical protein
VNIDDTKDVFTSLNLLRPISPKMRPCNRIVVEWPPFRSAPRIDDRLNAGELGTAVVSGIESSSSFGGAVHHLVALHIYSDLSEPGWIEPKSTKKPKKRKK